MRTEISFEQWWNGFGASLEIKDYPDFKHRARCVWEAGILEGYARTQDEQLTTAQAGEKFGQYVFHCCDSIEADDRSGMQSGRIPVGVLVIQTGTGLAAFCKSERSQMRNRDAAIAMIESKKPF